MSNVLQICNDNCPGDRPVGLSTSVYVCTWRTKTSFFNVNIEKEVVTYWCTNVSLLCLYMKFVKKQFIYLFWYLYVYAESFVVDFFYFVQNKKMSLH